MVTLSTFNAKHTAHSFATLGKPLAADTPHVIWAHGWGQDHQAFLPLAQSLERGAHHTLIDFPGFGMSAPPAEAWDTADYADAVAEWLATLPRGRRVWVGHSFGCRIGMRLAARHPEAIDGMVLAAGAGLRRRRSLFSSLQLEVRIRLFKVLRYLEAIGVDVSGLRARFGSADYRNAGAMRPILVKVVGEDQTDVARQIRCKVALFYGEKDDQTPPEMGERLSKLIPDATLSILPGLDHYTILTDGGPQITYAVSKMLEG